MSMAEGQLSTLDARLDALAEAFPASEEFARGYTFQQFVDLYEQTFVEGEAAAMDTRFMSGAVLTQDRCNGRRQYIDRIRSLDRLNAFYDAHDMPAPYEDEIKRLERKLRGEK